MARTLSEIYNAAKEERNKRLELAEFSNGSKMSVMDSFTWVTSASIWAFENLLDVFKVDLTLDLANRINGTPAYYINALLKYQHGDKLIMNDEGTQFSYASVDESKRIVKKVSYSEESDDTEVVENGVKTIYKFYDKQLVLRVATTNENGYYTEIDPETLIAIREYMRQISFAGTSISVVSRKGDILIPKLVVYYDGAVTQAELQTKVIEAINNYISTLDYNSTVYNMRIIDAINHLEHVTDVGFDDADEDHNGIYVVQFDDDGNVISKGNTVLQRVNRCFVPNAGFIKESSGIGDESAYPQWKDSIKFVVDPGK